MEVVEIISRIVHVSAAIVLVGGTTFMLFVLLPAVSQLDDAAHQKLRGLVTQRWKRFVHVGIALFLASGGYNYFLALERHKGQGLYHGLVGTKMILALAVFFIASVLVGRSAKFANMRENRGKWLSVAILLAAIIVAISGFVKVHFGSVK